MTHLHDTHCHVDLYPDYRRLIEECEQERIYTLAVTNTPSVFRVCADLTRDCRYVRPAVGLHPELAAQRQHELPLISDLLNETRYVGEIGLDYVTTDTENRRVQRYVFAAILEMAAGIGDRVLTIHSRRAAQEVVAMIGPRFPGTIILHWYSGSLSVLTEAAEHSYYFSVNPAMVTSAVGRKVIGHIPRDRILLETDGPFVTVNGYPARPRHVRQVVSGLAELWQEDATQVQTTLKQNFLSAFGTGSDRTAAKKPHH